MIVSVVLKRGICERGFYRHLVSGRILETGDSHGMEPSLCPVNFFSTGMYSVVINTSINFDEGLFFYYL